MATSRNDMYLLSTDVTFQHRVQAALLLLCVSIGNESGSVAQHSSRANFAVQILQNNNSGNGTNIWTQTFSNSVATDSNVIGDATTGGTVPIAVATLTAQAALVTDAHIDGALASQFNTYFKSPQ